VNILSDRVNVKNRDLVLVDDMISTGGSIVKATQFLKKQKCRRVFVACTHALLVNDAAKKIKKAGVAQIVSTNTIPGESAKVDVSRVIADALK
jgi:ribose-phosphate pyrophosphokinase